MVQEQPLTAEETTQALSDLQIQHFRGVYSIDEYLEQHGLVLDRFAAHLAAHHFTDDVPQEATDAVFQLIINDDRDLSMGEVATEYRAAARCAQHIIDAIRAQEWASL